MAYTAINDPQKHFNTALYTGDYESGGSIHKTQAIVGVGFQPDFMWFKNRDTTNGHEVYDSSRALGALWTPDAAAVEATPSTRIASYDSDGVTVKSDPSVNGTMNEIVAWLWKVNGGTEAANTDGSISSTIQVNTTAGFSIVEFASGSSGTKTIGHGLGAAPEFIIVVDRTASESHMVYHKGMATSDQHDKNLQLENNGALDTTTDGWGTAVPTSTVFGINSSQLIEANETFIAYCFTPIQGYSKFGSYTGNGNADGAFVYTGFKPAFIIAKRVDTGANWYIFDTARSTYNSTAHILYPDGNWAEATSTTSNIIDINSNGFKCRAHQTDMNGDGAIIVYVAFAKAPFVTSNGSPGNAR